MDAKKTYDPIAEAQLWLTSETERWTREREEQFVVAIVRDALALREALERADIALTNTLQLYSDRKLADEPRTHIATIRDRVRAATTRTEA